ncbi:hypothetical protein N7495_004253 [Penicillium taxi]|uniref:uncharacterized protein n=1 Tax=Penicillium taxi TaxID=168475 RepID=UPI002545B93B|nr:uncharacterized protein N7495_004253 [Penicillium taxi]KAJ5899509.1 hypothetical protein N7495_004253 [Penicillium taxi]
MSYELESKKRKFHRVLESISKPPAIDLTPKPTSTTPATAQDHPPTSLSIKKVRLNSKDTSNLASVSTSTLALPRCSRVSSTSFKRPAFAPWDRECFLERLETFRRVDRWTSKPPPINEVQWSKHGWVCSDVMRVGCVSGCGGSVVIKLPEDIDDLDGYDAEKAQERKEVCAKLVEEYEKRLSDGHSDNCPWRNKWCDATIQRLPLSNPDVALSGLRERYLNVVKMGDKLPAEDAFEYLEGFDLDDTIKMLPEEWLKPEKTPEKTNEESVASAEKVETPKEPTTEPVSINRAAFTLAFFGWSTVDDGGAGLVGCKACFRRLGLWMYKPKENGDITVYASLNAATEHMEYCPWIDGLAQSGTGSPNKQDGLLSGWEIVAQAAKVKHRRHARSRMSMASINTEPSTPTPDLDHDGLIDETATPRKTPDREWWTKFRRMRQVLKTKSPGRKSVAPK